jgi:UPF0755 protein
MAFYRPAILKAFLKTLFGLVLLAAAAVLAYGVWYSRTPVAMREAPVQVEIPRGASLRTVVTELQKAGLDIRRREFVFLVKSFGRERDIKAGNYLLARAPTPLELLEKLTRGDVQQAELRLIEGWTFAQFRSVLDNHPDLRHDTKGLGDAEVLKRIQAPEPHPEGLFFPDTYLFGKGVSDVVVLRSAYRAMQRHLKAEWDARQANVPYKSPYEALIMASIIEKETGQASEREQIGGVLVNRLRIGMRLQVDPTIIYGLGPSFDGNLRKKHLVEDAPYNTYTRAGLPPTPIAMPGLASLRAAVRPAKTDAMYYVSRGDGSSHFSRNIAEHNGAVRKYQLKR